MTEPTYTDYSEITKFTRCKTDLFALVEGQLREEAIQKTEHTLQFKRYGNEQHRRAFIDGNPLETVDGKTIYENEISSMTMLCALLDAGDEELDKTFEAEDEGDYVNHGVTCGPQPSSGNDSVQADNHALKVAGGIGVN